MKYSCSECLDGDAGLEEVCGTCGRKPGDPPFPELIRRKMASLEWQDKMSKARQQLGLPPEGISADDSTGFMLVLYTGFMSLWLSALKGRPLPLLSNTVTWLMFARIVAGRLATELGVTESDPVLAYLICPRRWPLGLVHPGKAEPPQEMEFVHQMKVLFRVPMKRMQEAMRASFSILLKGDATWAELQADWSRFFPSWRGKKVTAFKRSMQRAMQKKADRVPFYRQYAKHMLQIMELFEQDD